MKKRPLNNKLKAKRKSDNAVLMNTPEIMTAQEDSKNERIKKQFTQDAIIYERVKYPAVAMGLSLMFRI